MLNCTPFCDWAFENLLYFCVKFFEPYGSAHDIDGIWSSVVRNQWVFVYNERRGRAKNHNGLPLKGPNCIQFTIAERTDGKTKLQYFYVDLVKEKVFFFWKASRSVFPFEKGWFSIPVIVEARVRHAQYVNVVTSLVAWPVIGFFFWWVWPVIGGTSFYHFFFSSYSIATPTYTLSISLSNVNHRESAWNLIFKVSKIIITIIIIIIFTNEYQSNTLDNIILLIVFY